MPAQPKHARAKNRGQSGGGDAHERDAERKAPEELRTRE